ncbi:hypothetical protein E6P97_02960 [Patescibacteria group bacterium]|nr:MAG: hypothetical protein E6P97_02960 [Patescibacteria group bacterium]
MSMKTIIKKAAVALAVVCASVAIIGGGQASAAQIPYNPGGMGTSTTPVFNTFTGVPLGVGNEADFVKLRASNGDPKVTPSVSPFSDPLTDDCKVGDMYDIRTYIHNGASPDYNHNGSGPAVAHNTTVAMTAPLGTSAKGFAFQSTISASNAASVVDVARLNCGSNVQLQLVPQSVHVYSKNTGWNVAADSSVNGTLKIGSEVFGSGDVFACWDGRVLVIYTVKVVEVPQVPQASCDLLTVTALGDRKYKFDVKYTAKNGATFKSVSYTIKDSDGNSKAISENEYTFDKEGTFQVIATVTFMINGKEVAKTGDNCAKEVTVTPENCPVPGKQHLPKGHPECEYCPTNKDLPADDDRCVETPAKLPETGAAGLVGLFTAVSAAGTGAYRFVTRRRLV